MKTGDYLRVNARLRDCETNAPVEDSFTLIGFCRQQSATLKRVLSDVEKAYKEFMGTTDKTKWSPRAIKNFNMIRRNLLNVCGNIDNLTNNIYDPNAHDDLMDEIMGDE